jgi:hypothetical protein
MDTAQLPVRHQTRRQGHPYTLALTKTGKLFANASNASNAANTRAKRRFSRS